MCSFMNPGTLRGVSILNSSALDQVRTVKSFYDTELKVHSTSGHNDLCHPPRKANASFLLFPCKFLL